MIRIKSLSWEGVNKYTIPSPRKQTHTHTHTHTCKHTHTHAQRRSFFENMYHVGPFLWDGSQWEQDGLQREQKKKCPSQSVALNISRTPHPMGRRPRLVPQRFVFHPGRGNSGGHCMFPTSHSSLPFLSEILRPIPSSVGLGQMRLAASSGDSLELVSLPPNKQRNKAANGLAQSQLDYQLCPEKA